MNQAAVRSDAGNAWSEVFPAFLHLGLTSFGGPVAHLGYFRTEFVEKRRWLDEAAYAEVVALCQFLPGPASSQTGIALGLMRASYAGAFAAWLGFTAPSAVAIIVFGYGVARFSGIATNNALHGLKIVAVAVVAQAVIAMARALTPDLPRLALALAAGTLTLLVPVTLGQIVTIVAGAATGWVFLVGGARPGGELPVRIGPRVAIGALMLFFVLLIGLPLIASVTGAHAFSVIDGFYRSGALVFGGGHVVLPLLQATVVPPLWVSNDDFLAGYGAAQAMPGPLFTFAAFLGTVMRDSPNGWFGGAICLISIFLPSFLLVFGTLPFWNRLRSNAQAQSALAGINAAVVGLLAAALYNPVWTSAIFSALDTALAGLAFLLLAYRVPQWAVVAFGAVSAAVFAL